MLHATDVLHSLTGLKFGHPVYLFQQLGSTNDQAKQLADAGAPEGLLVLAEQQTAGRGRQNRRWHTLPGTALALSLVVRPELPAIWLPRLTMWAGLALSEAIEQVTGVATRLKWPNDVLVAGRKAAGILVEGALHGDHLEYAVVGIGVNVNAGPDPAGVDFPATDLQTESRLEINRLALLRAVLTHLEADYPGISLPDLRSRWQARLSWLQQEVWVRTETSEWSGRAEGVDDEGALLVRTEAGLLQRVVAGDVRLRPAAPPAARSSAESY